MELLHGHGDRAHAHLTRHVADRVLWWSLVAVAALGAAVFVAMLGIVLWGIFTGAPGIP